MLMRWVFRFRNALYIPLLPYIMLTITIAKNMNGLNIERVTPYVVVWTFPVDSTNLFIFSYYTVQHSPLK